ncbi:MAG TPA: hypothetical protein VM582_01940 [Candidatus Thermoplasmatota archaeon]|nr:hypothetical protein [Candidatus Thermoplasmatota archaeon]
MGSKALLALLLLAPLALAHAPGGYDPLVLDLHAFLTAEGRIDERAPAPGGVAFPASAPPGPAAPLSFALAAPVRFVPGAAFDVTLRVRADGLVVARDADGHAFEVNVEPGGAAQRIALDPPVLAPGSAATARAHVQAVGALYEEGQEMTLTIRPLMPLGERALVLVVGGEQPSTFHAPDMRVPAPADLRLQDLPHTEFLLASEAFEPPSHHAVNTFVVSHEGVRPPASGAWSANGTYVVLRGEEPPESAREHAHTGRAQRVEAAHEFRVNGMTARAHPGLGVVVRVHAPPVRVECVRNCAAPFVWTYAPEDAPRADPPSALVPPPRDARGIPASEDEPRGSDAPLPLLTLLAALALAARAKR